MNGPRIISGTERNEQDAARALELAGEIFNFLQQKSRSEPLPPAIVGAALHATLGALGARCNPSKTADELWQILMTQNVGHVFFTLGYDSIRISDASLGGLGIDARQKPGIG
jgi:hypothetical protein